MFGRLESRRLLTLDLNGGEPGDAHAQLLAVFLGTIDELKLNVGALQLLLLLARPRAPIGAVDADLVLASRSAVGVAVMVVFVMVVLVGIVIKVKVNFKLCKAHDEARFVCPWCAKNLRIRPQHS